jgi:hypothetical protein
MDKDRSVVIVNAQFDEISKDRVEAKFLKDGIEFLLRNRVKCFLYIQFNDITTSKIIINILNKLVS